MLVTAILGAIKFMIAAFVGKAIVKSIKDSRQYFEM